MILPRNWQTMSLDALYGALNDPRRFPTSRCTIEAIIYAVRERGVAALDEPANLKRLARCDRSARSEIKARLMNLPEVEHA